MQKTIKTGFFTMDTVHAVMAFSELEKAQDFLRSIVKESATARVENVEKVNTMINKARNIKELAMAVSNFMLAHPSENLKTLR